MGSKPNNSSSKSGLIENARPIQNVRQSLIVLVVEPPLSEANDTGPSKVLCYPRYIPNTSYPNTCQISYNFIAARGRPFTAFPPHYPALFRRYCTGIRSDNPKCSVLFVARPTWTSE
ncbi:hypothetical protein GWI33_012665 [Rhynchophorus ferrugineus]|uniref:Uncharacterized protein n=1 Tax=Rhynchophorus ferrugineus TaxID=354439 RepID=A0A834I8U0_RHYFE|nr:hypothetical protein GWI33_012665 [Rhynchophorus ferrugineus]